MTKQLFSSSVKFLKRIFWRTGNDCFANSKWSWVGKKAWNSFQTLNLHFLSGFQTWQKIPQILFIQYLSRQLPDNRYRITCLFSFFPHCKVFTHKKVKFLSAVKHRQYHTPAISNCSFSSGAGSHLIDFDVVSL